MCLNVYNTKLILIVETYNIPIEPFPRPILNSTILSASKYFLFSGTLRGRILFKERNISRMMRLKLVPCWMCREDTNPDFAEVPNLSNLFRIVRNPEPRWSLGSILLMRMLMLSMVPVNLHQFPSHRVCSATTERIFARLNARFVAV